MNEIIGFGIAPFASSDDTIRYALLAEKHGLHSFWLGEAYHGRSAIALLSAVSVQTKRIELGTAIVGVYTRHPALLAMEAATIDELSGGRFNLGLGVNVTSLVKHGLITHASRARSQKPLAAISDSIEIIRRLIAGESVVYKGKVFNLPEPGSSLDFHGFKPVRPKLPIYIGSRSPLILQLAGRCADGVILSRSLSASGSYVRDSIQHVLNGARKVGRRCEEITIASNLTFSVDRDSQLAKDHVREVIALYVADPTLTAEDLMLQHSKVSEDDLLKVKEEFKQAGVRSAAKAVTPEMIDEFAIAGTPDECIPKLEGLVKLGIQIPIAFDLIGPNPELAIELIATQIMPHLHEK